MGGITTQELQSARLSSRYPSVYRECQITNMGRDELVVTYPNGEQVPIPSTGDIDNANAYVQIESRRHIGARSESNGLRTVEIPIKTKKTIIPASMFRNSPFKFEEANIIISTIEQAILAKNMMCSEKYSSFLPENRFDLDIPDPRFVFQVIDPRHEWDVLYVNVFGQTIVLRAGQFNERIPSDRSPGLETAAEVGRLICYLKYPMDYCRTTDTTETIFEIELADLHKLEPFVLPSGETVCISDTLEGLQEVIGKRNNHHGNTNGVVANSKMVPKEVFDAAVENYKQELSQLKETSRTKLETLTVKKEQEIADLKYKLAAETRAKEVAEAKSAQWEGIHAANSKIITDQEKVRQESYETSKKQLDNMMTIAKIAGTTCAAVISFAVTILVKSKSKK